MIPIHTEKNTDLKAFIIAGPCSAESEKQVMKTAEALLKIGGVDAFRAGIWKPRTKPGHFEGVGEKALEWLKRVQEELHLPVITEVITGTQLKQITDHGIQMVWIGARTTSNPVYVQQIAESIDDTDMRFLIKNPMHPDVELWMGAVERIKQAGIRDVSAVHRGFFPIGKSAFRNQPMWEVPIEFMRKMPDVPLFCDPSHIAGKKEHIPLIVQQALNLNVRGFMIETHCDAKNALSDARQQLVPEELKRLLQQIEFPALESGDEGFIIRMNQLRKEIDQIDYQLIDLLSERMSLVDEIGACKARNKVSVLQLKRWEEILHSRLKYARQNNLEDGFVRQLLKWIHKEAIRRQNEMLNSSAPGNASET